MTDTAKLILALWEPFIEEVKTGDPVFFCFYREWLVSALSEIGISTDDPTKIINDAANRFFIVSSDEVIVRPQALAPIEGGFSAAIILVCQQVLAVEEMVRQQSGYTENAYFPRLRRMISPKLEELSLNPFSFDEFEGIWRTLAKEIRSIHGSSDASITFRFGVEQGANKARSFPLSQALLSREDLYLLVRRIGVNRLKAADSQGRWALIRSERTQLRRRAQRLLSLHFLRDRIVEQVKGFVEKLDPSKLHFVEVQSQTAEKFEMRFYKDSVDWFTDEFRAYLLNGKGERLDDEASIRRELSQNLTQKGYFVLPCSELGDSWIKTNADLEIKAGDTFLIIGRKAEFPRAWTIISSLVRSLTSATSESLESKFSDNIVIHEIKWPKSIPGAIKVRNGGISGGATESAVNRAEWLGGLAVNQGREKFLKDYLPISVQFGSEAIPISSVIRINDKYLSFSAFQQSLRTLDANQSYTFSFPNDRRARLSIAVSRGDPNDRMGYLVEDSGSMAPSLDRITEEDDAIVGFEIPDSFATRTLEPEICGQILVDLKSQKGRKLSDQEVEFVRSSITDSKIPNEVKFVIDRMLSTHATLSNEVLAKIGLIA